VIIVMCGLVQLYAQSGLRCRGRDYEEPGERCCTVTNPCDQGEGDCDDNAECGPGLVCGENNCKQFGQFFHAKDDCCVLDQTSQVSDQTSQVSDQDLFGAAFPNVPLEPPAGQRCRGRNYEGKRCCTPEQPCEEGEGDCDGRGDGGLNDGDRGCKGDLVCGSNNCLKFGLYYHKKDDCCEKPGSSSTTTTWKPHPDKPILPPEGQRCRGRNYDGRRCCTPADPCDEGEGDCDGREDGSEHDGDRGCKGTLVCGSNNCLKFGLYYHEKDDCCERPIEEIQNEIASFWNLQPWKPIK